MVIKEPSTLPEIPRWWIGSKPEYYVYNALIKLGMEGRFTYQASVLGGRGARGGAVIDFEIPELNLALNVTSRYYHYGTTPQRMAEELQRATLEGMGLRVIFIDEKDILRNPAFFVSEALRGIDHSVFRR